MTTTTLNQYFDPRLMRAVGAGLAITIGLFWSMHLMIAAGRGGFKAEKQEVADFIRLKRNTELETRERKKPPKPPPPKAPPPPQMKVAAVAPTPNAPVPFAMPKLSLSGVSGGPFMGDVVSGGMAGDSDLIPLVAIQPQYPRQAQRDGIEGEVVLELTVGADGQVKNARVISAKPRGVFESAAIAAAYKARFRPKIVDGKPVEQKGIRPFKFNLDKEQK